MNPDPVVCRIAARYGLTLEDLRSRSGVKWISAARRQVYAVLREPPWCWTYKTIGQYMGGRDKQAVRALLATTGAMAQLPPSDPRELHVRALANPAMRFMPPADPEPIGLERSQAARTEAA